MPNKTPHRLTCTRCDHDFDAPEDGRCPQCLRRSGVYPQGRAPRRAGPRAGISGLGMIVAIAIIAPVMVIFPGRPWWQTFLVAMVGFGAGHALDTMRRRT